ncbi:MAG TPA: AAA domain-containing protein [Candidatus Gastranaerophilaceae bacterium]|nr:AAA domain-containing protein [Candidatus Gastranaerophilaceae bacterium]HPT41042.1 AAA domain-containing protein [Candidatus Gastranaerophilaceae bacterium]
MLQEATRALNSAFNNSFIKKLSQYLHDCVREEVKSATFRNLKQDKDNKWIFLKEEEFLFHNYGEYLRLDGSDSKLTELMIQSELSQKDKYLIYGYLFLVGKSSKNKKQNEFLTPLLYMPCKLERNGVNINCMLQDEFLSLNTGALTAMMKKNDDEDEVEQLLEGLLDVVPELPITDEKLEIFLTTLKSIIPDIEIKIDHSEDVDEDNIEKDFYNEVEKIDFENLEEAVEEGSVKTAVKLEKITLTNQCSIILTKRPSITAGVLHELMQIAEKPSGMYRETALNIINEEYLQTKGKLVDNPIKQLKDLKDFVAVTPLSLSDSQENVIKSLENNHFVAVYGPPGTGKSQTIVNLVAHLIANGKTILVASRMDKAVDVVSERLNELGAPFLALRAGRLNYQKQLSFQLQDLLSNKVDLDSEYENAIFADVKDMKDLVNTLRDLENRCEQVIKLEHEWQELFVQKNEQEKALGQTQFIKELLKKAEIEQVENLISTIEKNLEKTGFFVSLSNYSSKNKLKKLLKLNDFNENYENLSRLAQELEFSKTACEMRLIEANIQKLGNLHVMAEQIRMLKRKQRNLAIDILKSKRRESLKGLLRDQIKRQRLIVHTKSLVERKKNLQNRLLEGEDFKPLLEAFPCWCVTTYAISGSLPMKPGLFDVAIIDEASQCDIASCFPILYRAKRAVVVGDDKQLPHLSFLEKAKEQSFLSQYSIPDKYQLMWRFRTNSMFDLANYYSMNPVLLDEHFRSLPPIINFSNDEFYGSRIRIMKRNKNEKVLELVYVPDGKVDFDATRNLPEVEAVVKKLQEIIIEDERKNPDNPTSIGIISPFRAQVEQLKTSVARILSEHMIRKHSIEIGTAHTFQGDERDIMLISWAFASNSFVQSLTFLQKPNLFNVAITRARHKMINFISRDPKELPDGLLRSYMSYIQEYQNKQQAIENKEIDENFYKNNFEREIAQAIRDLGHEVKAGVEIAGFSLDLLVNDKIAIECDGVEDSKKLSGSNLKKQSILERSGYKINRITFREWQYSPKACLDRVLIE